MDETIASGVLRSVKQIWLLGLVFMAMSIACGGPRSSPTEGPVATLTPPARTIAPSGVPNSSMNTPGPYSTIESAEGYVRDQQASNGLLLSMINPESTWRSSAVLHVLHATPG